MAVGAGLQLVLGDSTLVANPPAGSMKVGADTTTNSLYLKDSAGTIQLFGTEATQDIVGAMFVDTATIDFTYNDGLGQISAILVDGSVTTPKMGLTAGTLTFPDALNIALGTAGAGTQLGTGATQKLGFYGATPVVQIAGATDVLAGLVTLGLRAASSNPPLNLGTGTITAGTTGVGALTATSIAGTGTVALTDTMTITDAKNIVVGSTTGTKIGTATSQKLGFWNAAPVVQTTGATDVLAGLVTIGLRAASSNPPLDLGSGALGSGSHTLTDAANIVVGTTTGTKIGTGTTQKLGFFNATPVVQEAGSNDVLASLVTLGLRAASSNPPLNLGTGLLTAGSMNLSSKFIVDTSGRLGWNGSVSGDSFAYMQGAHPGAVASMYGIYQDFSFPSTTITLGQVLRLQVKTAAAAFTLATGDAIFIATPSKGAGSAITNVTGLRIDPQTGGATTSIGARIDAATTAALWLGGDADSVTQAGGIVFGSTRDTNFYRLAASSLKTDGALTVNGTLNPVGGINATNHITLTLGSNLILETSTGTKFGTATNQKLAFYNSTPVVQPAGTVDVLASLVTLGLRAASSNPPLDLGTGALGSGTHTLTDATNIVVGSTTGTKIGTATTQKLGFFNATPVVQEAGTNDVLASLVTLGLRAASSNPPLNLGTGTLTCGAQTIQGNSTYSDAVNLIFNATTGTQIGTGITQKLAFYGTAPVAQRAGAAQVAAAATAATNVTPFGYSTAAQADAIRTLVNELRAALVALGLIKGAA